jgi:hypothetical protein
MGMKLEWLLVIVIGVTSYVTMTTKLSDQNVKKTQKLKELEFTNTTFTEVTTQGREGVAFGTHGVRIGGVLHMENVRYHNNKIKLLLADNAAYIGKKIYLDGNVTVHQMKAHDYYTEHADYDQKSEILHIASPFVACIRDDVISGSTLLYYMKKKEVFATSVDAVFYTEKGDTITYDCQDALAKLKRKPKRG